MLRRVGGFVVAHSVLYAVYFAAGGAGRLCPTVVVSGAAGALDALRSLKMPSDAMARMIAITATKKLALPSVVRAGPGFVSGG